MFVGPLAATATESARIRRTETSNVVESPDRVHQGKQKTRTTSNVCPHPKNFPFPRNGANPEPTNGECWTRKNNLNCNRLLSLRFGVPPPRRGGCSLRWDLFFYCWQRKIHRRQIRETCVHRENQDQGGSRAAPQSWVAEMYRFKQKSSSHVGGEITSDVKVWVNRWI